MTGTTVETTIRIVSRWQKDRLVSDAGGRLVLACCVAHPSSFMVAGLDLNR
jgi:hypothetical protein